MEAIIALNRAVWFNNLFVTHASSELAQRSRKYSTEPTFLLHHGARLYLQLRPAILGQLDDHTGTSPVLPGYLPLLRSNDDIVSLAWPYVAETSSTDTFQLALNSL